MDISCKNDNEIEQILGIAFLQSRYEFIRIP